MMQRRNFLRLMGSAPIAAPMAAKEAVAAKVSVATSGLVSPFDDRMVAVNPVPGGSYLQNLKNELAELLSGAKCEELRERSRPRSLDPDLAAMRSLSMSAAVEIQWERNVKKAIADRRSYLLACIRHETR